jgi:hypothetical protein
MNVDAVLLGGADEGERARTNMAPTGESDPGELDNLAKDSEEQREY